MIEIYCDGSCYNSPQKNTMGVGVVILKEEILSSAHYYAGLGTNNIAEYIAILLGVLMLKNTHTYWQEDPVIIHSDSQLIINQINGEYIVKDKTLKGFYSKIMIEAKQFSDISFKWVPRDHPNQQKADELSRLGNPYFNPEYLAPHIQIFLDSIK